MRSQYVRESDIFLVGFALNSRHSFLYIKPFFDVILRTLDKNINQGIQNSVNSQYFITLKK